MTTIIEPQVQPTDPDGERVEAFAGQLFMAGLAAFELLNIELGIRLGLYAALTEHGPATTAELAGAAGIAERYAQEWLEQQAVAGVLEVDDVSAGAGERRYGLPAPHAEVLLNRDSLAYVAPLAAFLPVAGNTLEAVAGAFRTGGGVAYADYGVHDIQAALNRPTFINLLAQDWVPALPGVAERLAASPAARVAEVGCGEGGAAIALALAYPGIHVDGFDLDDASIAAARAAAEDAGLTDRVTFEVRDASQGLAGSYDVVLAIEMLHDVSNPVGILRSMRALRAEGGTVLVVDERVADRFTAPGDEMERFMYACSVLHCLPAGMTEEGSAGTGTVMRTDTVRRYAAGAGFEDVEVLPVEHPQFRLYRLVG